MSISLEEALVKTTKKKKAASGTVSNTLDLEMVQGDGFMIKYVAEQTPELCLAAVQQNGLAVAYIKEQTPEICLAAVKQNRNALLEVREQIPEVCLAVSRNVRGSFKQINFIQGKEGI